MRDYFFGWLDFDFFRIKKRFEPFLTISAFKRKAHEVRFDFNRMRWSNRADRIKWRCLR